MYRADVPKAPETVTQNLLQQQQAFRKSLAALETELRDADRRTEQRLAHRTLQRELAESIAATKQDTDRSLAVVSADVQKALTSLAEELESARKFMLQTAQLGWLNHELIVENASGIRRVATASQELTANSAKLADTMRQLSESLAAPAQGAGGPARCHSGLGQQRQMRWGMHHGSTGGRSLVILMAFLLPSIAVPDALAGELEKMRESYDSKLRAHQKRITEIEAKGRIASADPVKRADAITRDRIADIRASLKGGVGATQRLAELAEKASGDAKALVDLYKGQSEHLDVVTGEWGADGTERKRLREAITALQKNSTSPGRIWGWRPRRPKR